MKSLFSLIRRSLLSFTAITTIAISLSLLGCGGSESSNAFRYPITGNGSVALSWQEPTLNEDGSTLNDLAGYRVHYGLSSGDYIEHVSVGNYTTCSIDNLPEGEQIFIVVTAYDTSGNESLPSNEIVTIIN